MAATEIMPASTENLLPRGSHPYTVRESRRTVDRDFEADNPNQKWLADFTYIWTAQGWLYVAVVLDLFSRRVVGWSMKADRDATLVMDALMMAVWHRGKADALLHHSDQGSQYTSEQFQRLLTDNGITCSMSRAGNVWDNSAMEMGWLPPSPEGIAMCQSRAVESDKTERTANERYNDRGGSGKERFPTPWGFDDWSGQVPQEADTPTISSVHGRSRTSNCSHGSVWQCQLLGQGDVAVRP
jgi:transposase InsO family protein